MNAATGGFSPASRLCERLERLPEISGTWLLQRASQERESQSRVSEDPGGPHTQASASSGQLSQALPWIRVDSSLSEA
ncbi:hypothetical protein U0070_004206 [Myodes glareolus]|uniref:Uncharacterized protein n=1 Tax=Myodes glareolus TaxID=447135 RepID=A0AAW0HP66_MYOGA